MRERERENGEGDFIDTNNGICEIVERKLVVAHEWEEKRVKGKRGEQKSL